MKNIPTPFRAPAPDLTAVPPSSRSKPVVCLLSLIALLVLGDQSAWATTTNFLAGASQTWVAPSGVTNVTVECWGTGGAGGSAKNTVANTSRAGGGGGGGYIKANSIAVTPGTTYTFTVPAGPAGAVSAGLAQGTVANGSDTTFTGDGGVTVTAKGGLGGGANVDAASSGVGAAGLHVNQTGGTATQQGGDGVAGGSNGAGGGGGGAGDSGAGGVGKYYGDVPNTAAGGTGSPNAGGSGGVGRSSVSGDLTGGGNGGNPGGGGGGARCSTITYLPGGKGGDGQIILTYATPSRTWTGGGADDNWSTSANWTLAGAPVAGDNLIFSGSTRQNNTNNLNVSAGLTNGWLKFTGGGFVLNGNPLGLDPGVATGQITNSAGTNTLALPINIVANNKFWSIAAGSELRIAGPLTNNAAANPLATIVDGGTVRITSSGNVQSSRMFTINNGALIVDGGNVNTTNDGFRLAPTGSGLTTAFNVTNSGTVRIAGAGSLRMGQSGSSTSGGIVSVHVSSGKLELAPTAAGGTPSWSGCISLGETAGVTTTFTQSGGLVWLNPAIYSADINSLNLVYNAGGGTYNLNGGTLMVREITNQLASAASAIFNFNGGTLMPSSNSLSGLFIPSGITANVQSGGAIIDSTNINITVAQALTAGSPSGGLTKLGTSTLTLSGTNTYTGNTTISAGTLALGVNGSISNTPLISIAAGAILDVSAKASYTLTSSNSLSANGTATAATIKGNAGVNSVSLGSRPITLTYDGVNPALTISQGQLVLSANAFTVNRASVLADGDYTIVSATSGSNIVATGPFTANGTALTGKVGAISAVNSNVVLTVSTPAGKLAVTAVPVSATAGTSFSVTVEARDSGGTPTAVTADTGILLTASGAGTLSGNTATITAGQTNITLTTVQYTKAETITLTASRTSGDVMDTSGASSAFTVAPGAASQLVFSTQPSANNTNSVPFATQPVVQIKDALGNVVTNGADATATVALTLTTGTGTLGGTSSMAAVAGEANFAGKGLNINAPGTNKVLTATATLSGPGAVATTTSPAFAVIRNSATLPLRWAASGSGDWDLSTANWKDTNAATTTFQNGEAVRLDETYITAHTTVTVPSTVTPASVTVSNATYDYTISGSGSISGVPLLKQGAGNLTINSTNTFSGSPSQIQRGTVVLAAPTTFNSELWAGSTTNSGANLVISNTTVTVTNYLAISRGGGSSGNMFNLTLTNGVLNVAKVSCGWDGGLAGNNAFQNINLQGNSVLTDTGIGNTGFLLGESAGSTATMVLANNSSIINLNTYFSIGVSGTSSLTIKDNASMTNGGDFNVADVGSAQGTLNLQDNSQITAASVYIGKSAACVGTVTQSGGTFTGNVGGNNEFQIGRSGQGTWAQSGGTNNAAGYVSIGRLSGGVGSMNISGGAFNQTGTGTGLIVGETGTGTLTISGSGVVNSVSTGGVVLGQTVTTGAGTLNLNGGTLVAIKVAGGSGSSTFNFNGGTLKAGSGANSTFMSTEESGKRA